MHYFKFIPYKTKKRFKKEDFYGCFETKLCSILWKFANLRLAY
jgi:hypothetical protein